MKLISVVVPVFNEEEVVEQFVTRVRTVMDQLPHDLNYEIVFVDDGSTDSTHQIICAHAAQDQKIRLVAFSRNFGHQAAIAAGLRAATGDAIITIDCDFQDPPELIPEFVARWLNGANIVLGRRVSRHSDSVIKRVSARVFYNLMSRLSDSEVEPEVADFRLVSRGVADILRDIEESSPYWRGLVQWVGFQPQYVDYEREARVAGTTKYSIRKMIKLGLSGVTSFSDRPLIGVSMCGLVVTGFSAIYSFWVLISKVIWPDRSVPGYITAILLTLFLSGIQLLVLGLIGIYVSAVNRNARNRPDYIVWLDRCQNVTLKNELDKPRFRNRAAKSTVNDQISS